MNKDQAQAIVRAITLPPPPIECFSGIWNYSNDVLLYDQEGNEWVGYAVYRWEGDDDAPQVASWDNFEGWHSDDKGWCSESVVLWQPLTDEVMETAFARLADELEAQAAAELEKRLALLSVMLPYHINRYQRILKALERRGTLQSLEAADYVREKLKTAQAWRDELKEAERGSHETANMGKAP